MGSEFDVEPFGSLLSHVVDNRGRTCPTAPSGIPLIATNCVTNDSLYPSYDTVRYVDEQTYKTWFRGHPEPGDFLFVLKGSPGRVCLVPDPVDFCIAQDMVAVRADPRRVYPRFLFALLRSQPVQRQIEQLHVGTMIPHFKKGDFDKLLLPLPSRAVQESIGDFYWTLSHKIELNRRMSQTLESMARALFKSWFVDFDPVRSKAKGRETGSSPRLSDLFPDSLEDSDLGEIPTGWRVAPIGELAVVAGGSTPSTGEATFWHSGRNYWATPKDLSALATPVLLETERKITDAGLAQIGSGLLPPGTVLLSSRAPIGYLAIAEVPMSINQGFIAMRPAAGVSSLFLLYWAEWAHEEIVSRANGSTFLEISKSSFRPIRVAAPTGQVMESFDQVARPVYSRMVANERETRTLTALRETLLPRLVSGDLPTASPENLMGAIS